MFSLYMIINFIIEDETSKCCNRFNYKCILAIVKKKNIKLQMFPYSLHKSLKAKIVNFNFIVKVGILQGLVMSPILDIFT